MDLHFFLVSGENKLDYRRKQSYIDLPNKFLKVFITCPLIMDTIIKYPLIIMLDNCLSFIDVIMVW